MTHIETLVRNEIRKGLENLEKQGVGYIECEQSGVIYYNVDGRNISVQVSDTNLSDWESDWYDVWRSNAWFMQRTWVR